MKAIKKQNENIEKLLQLKKENPYLQIIPMVHFEVCASDDYSFWMGSWGEPRIDEVYFTEEYIYFKSKSYSQLFDDVFDIIEEDNPTMSISEIDKKAEEVVNNYKWEKCIVVYIDLP